ncbi:hypothetical protein NC653_036296 [Populus alba x Populus x berolinensis]|uniref:Uncharacterized protein n=1 Tax=Populus alba x Populus x berolinensis TaxID=444605 RepID=A0AAD6PUQ2_9ROSI|nr:hypothetical protein NC653_036296 [Populus alba x Populus x berolinensis]
MGSRHVKKSAESDEQPASRRDVAVSGDYAHARKRAHVKKSAESDEQPASRRDVAVSGDYAHARKRA